MIKRTWMAAIAVGVGLGLVGGGAASAQSVDPACRQANNQAATNDTIVGGLAGALLGTAVAGKHQKLEGAAVGGIGGALLGNAIGQSNAEPCPPGYYRAPPPPAPPALLARRWPSLSRRRSRPFSTTSARCWGSAEAAAPVSATNSKASRCGVGCSRCASKSSTACYACKTGYVLNGAGSCGESCRAGGGRGGALWRLTSMPCCPPSLPPPRVVLPLVVRRSTSLIS